MAFTCSCVMSGLASTINAAIPAMSGVAILVPDLLVYPSEVAASGAIMLDPMTETSGFTRPSEVYPLLEYIARPKSLSRLATVIGRFASPGLSMVLQPANVAPPNSFPADRKVMIPEEATASICWLQAEEPSLSKCISSCCSPREEVSMSIPLEFLFSIAHSAPSIMSCISPSQQARILITQAPGATPIYLAPSADTCPPPVPAAIPAT